MKFIDWFAGIGGIRLGLERSGHECVWSCEKDGFARRVYGARFGREPESEDICGVKAGDIPEADIWTGGFPCQDLSTSGRRTGIHGERSGLVWKLLALAGERRPEWIFLENVRGLLTGTDGVLEPEDEDVGEAAEGLVSWFGVLLGALVELGYVGCARVLDARYFGVPQRRRRVFILARHLGTGGRHPGELLLERQGVPGDRGAGRATRPEPAGAAADGARVGGRARATGVRGESVGTLRAAFGDAGQDVDAAQAGHFVPSTFSIYAQDGNGADLGAKETDEAPTLVARRRDYPGPLAKLGLVKGARALRYRGPVVKPFSIFSQGSTAKAEGAKPTDVARTLTSRPFTRNEGGTVVVEGRRFAEEVDTAPALTTENASAKTDRGTRIVARLGPQQGETGWTVRRLTPRECERLQGLPDDWTLIRGSDGKLASDGPRYRVIGNSVAEPVIRWIGHRLKDEEEGRP